MPYDDRRPPERESKGEFKRTMIDPNNSVPAPDMDLEQPKTDQEAAALAPIAPDPFAAAFTLLALITDHKNAAARLRELKSTIEAERQAAADAEAARAALAAREAVLNERTSQLDQRAEQLDQFESRLLEEEREHKEHFRRVREACAIGREADDRLRRRAARLAGIFSDEFTGTLTQTLPNWDAVENALGIGGERAGQAVEDRTDLLPAEPVEHAMPGITLTRSRSRPRRGADQVM